MDLRHIRMLLNVLECGNISTAAEMMGMNQPALSKMLRRLEGELEVPLFERSARGVEPTIYGETLSHFARAIDANYRSALREIDALRDATVGEVVIGAGGTWRDSVLPDAISGFLASRPRAKVRVEGGSPDKLLDGLVSGALDFILVPDDLAPTLSKDILVDTLIETELVIVARQGHPALAIDDLPIEDLAKMDWVLPSGSFVRTRFDSLFKRHNIVPPIPRVEDNDVHFLFRLVERSDMLSYVTRIRASHVLDRLSIVDALAAKERSRSGIMRLRSRHLTPLCKALLTTIRKELAQSNLSVNVAKTGSDIPSME